MLNKKLILVILTFLLAYTFATAQKAVAIWAAEHEGYYMKTESNDKAQVKAIELLKVLRRLPFFTHPIGFDLSENLHLKVEDGIYKGSIVLAMPKYYYDYKQRLQKEGEYCHLNIHYNDLAALFDSHKMVLNDENTELYTDTTRISEITMNNYPLGYATSTFAGSGIRMFVINPKRISYAVYATREDFAKCWISKFESEIQSMDKNHPYTRFIREKINYYKNILNQPIAERRRPANYSNGDYLGPKDPLLGPYKGFFPYELSDKEEDSNNYLYKLNPGFFDKRLPLNAIQVLVFEDGFSERDSDELKNFLDKEFYPKLDYKAIADLMYK